MAKREREKETFNEARRKEVISQMHDIFRCISFSYSLLFTASKKKKTTKTLLSFNYYPRHELKDGGRFPDLPRLPVEFVCFIHIDVLSLSLSLSFSLSLSMIIIIIKNDCFFSQLLLNTTYPFVTLLSSSFSPSPSSSASSRFPIASHFLSV